MPEARRLQIGMLQRDAMRAVRGPLWQRLGHSLHGNVRSGDECRVGDTYVSALGLRRASGFCGGLEKAGHRLGASACQKI